MAPMANNLVVSNINLEKTLSMTGGKGETSYVNNSQSQGQHARMMLHLLTEALDGVRLSSPESGFAVADLGCSCGSNTVYTVEVIIKHMIKRYEAAGCEVPEFSAFFSDLPSNDFNTLFQLLPPYGGATMEDCLASDNHRSYFVAGVPGSFHRRLFSAKSIDVFYSAFSLHWLSQIPEAVLDKRSKAYNKGKVFVHGATDATANEYKKQFQTDLGNFLRSRSKEMKRGGSMFFVCLGRTSPDPTHQGAAGHLFGTHFQDAWDDLVKEGLISSEKHDSFNIPIYAASVEEMKEVVESEGSFMIKRLEVFRGCPLAVSNPDDAAEVGLALANSCRSVCNCLVEAHIGVDLCNYLFSRFAKRATNQFSNLPHFDHVLASLFLA
ncbi:hypothetical protein ACS0TY_032641 [Phlomoides rotata]